MSVSDAGIGQQVADRRIEEALGLLGGDAAPGQHARDDVGHAMPLRDGERRHLLALVEPVLPGKPGRRALDTEKETLLGRHAPVDPRSMAAQ